MGSAGAAGAAGAAAGSGTEQILGKERKVPRAFKGH